MSSALSMFPIGFTSKNGPGPIFLNFSVQMRTGVFNKEVGRPLRRLLEAKYGSKNE